MKGVYQQNGICKYDQGFFRSEKNNFRPWPDKKAVSSLSAGSHDRPANIFFIKASYRHYIRRYDHGSHCTAILCSHII